MHTKYIEKIKNGAIQGWLTHKILPSITIAQGILESGGGTSKLSLPPYNNNFGIKWVQGDKQKYEMFDTKEWDGSKFIWIKAPFRVYDDINDSVADHAQFFSSTEWRKKNYAKVIGERDYVKASRALVTAERPYATDPTYDTKLIKIINQYHLSKYDNEAFQLEKRGGQVSKGKHLVICGHGQGRNTYDSGAVNMSKGYKEADYVRKLADNMSKYSSNITYIKDKNIYDYGTLASVSKGYDTVTELHFNAFNKQANGTEVLIHSNLNADEVDNNILNVLNKYFKNRGFKKVNNIMNVNIAYANNINYRLVEVCFIDNDTDMDIYIKNQDSIAKGLVESIEGIIVTDKKQEVKQNSQKEYIVQSGDTLWKISREFGLTVDDIKRHNGLKSDGLSVGQKLIINSTNQVVNNSSSNTSVSTNSSGQLDKMLKWFEDRVGKVKYSMDLTLRQGPNYYDCSSAVYSALKHAGFKTKINYLGNTETLFKEKGSLFKEITRNEIKRGDIFVSGVEGGSLGSAGHTGVVYDSNRIIHCTYPRNGIAITPIDGWTGSPVRWFRIVGVNDSKDTQASSVTSKNETVYTGNEIVTLPEYVDTWRVYDVGGSYTVGSEIGALLPSKFGGLTYDVLGWLDTNVAKIRTESYGEVGIYIGSETGAKIIKKENIEQTILDTSKTMGVGEKKEPTRVKLEFVKDSKGTLAHFAEKFESGKLIPQYRKGQTYTIIGNKRVNVGASRIAYRLKELNEWVLEQDILEAYGMQKVEFNPYGSVYPAEFSILYVGDTVTIRKDLETYANGTKADSNLKGGKYRIVEVSNMEMSYSKRAYRLAGMTEYILEEDIEEAWINAKPFIEVDNNRKIEEKIEVELSGLIDGKWVNGNLNGKITIGEVVVNGQPVPITYLSNDKEYSSYGVFGNRNGINSIKMNVPSGVQYRVKVENVGWTNWVSGIFVGSKDNKIIGLEVK